MNANLNGQCAQHLPINLNWGVAITFYSHPVGNLNTHVSVESDKSTGERRKLPQSDY
jgi:hypothetical protein